ncbi:MAG: uracil-DNA glycosylase, partial [Alphaproteobacteria bacterium]|nr:uracil-DNA glycosylase [Alphaproteobacteria bacterium]
AEEDMIGRAFVGRSGKLLDKMLASIGLDRTCCYICNILPWRPPGNRSPSDAEITVCLPFLKKQMKIITPDYIVALGAVAVNSLLGNADTISKLRGKWLEYEISEKKKAQIIATYHPAYILRTPAQKAKVWSDFLRLKKAMNENNQQPE